MFTGARLGEICQLDVSDIRRIDDIVCIVIPASSLVGSTDKRLKIGTSYRIIPLHPILLDCDLTQFADQKRRNGQMKSFDDFETGKLAHALLHFRSGALSSFVRAERGGAAPAFIPFGIISETSYVQREPTMTSRSLRVRLNTHQRAFNRVTVPEVEKLMRG